MSRTDKDRPGYVRDDDNAEKGWCIDHNHGLQPCDYQRGNNTRLHKQQYNPAYASRCTGSLMGILPRAERHPNTKRSRQYIEQRFRQGCRLEIQALRYNADDDRPPYWLWLPHPKRVVEINRRAKLRNDELAER